MYKIVASCSIGSFLIHIEIFAVYPMRVWNWYLLESASESKKLGIGPLLQISYYKNFQILQYNIYALLHL